MEFLLRWLKSLAILEILGLLGNLSILIALILFVTGEEERRNQSIYQAWQLINSSTKVQGGDGGRKKALESLNTAPSKFPFFWLSSERNSLRGLTADDADLAGIQLPEADLRDSDLSWSTLERANLQEANLQNADLVRAQMQDADLREADLSESNLMGVDLRGANLKNATLFGALYADADTPREVCERLSESFSIHQDLCWTKFSADFDPKAEGMKPVRSLDDLPSGYLE